MRCRNYVDSIDENGNINKSVVWFNSVISSKGTLCGTALASETIFVSNIQYEHADNYVDSQNAVAMSLSQKLSVIKGELWTNINYGLPLFEKYKSKAIMDAYVLQQLNKHSEVRKVINFTSTLFEHAYSCNCTILTNYGTLDISI